MRTALGDRIRGEAQVASRAGQYARLMDLAAEVDAQVVTDEMRAIEVCGFYGYGIEARVGEMPADVLIETAEHDGEPLTLGQIIDAWAARQP